MYKQRIRHITVDFNMELPTVETVVNIQTDVTGTYYNQERVLHFIQRNSIKGMSMDSVQLVMAVVMQMRQRLTVHQTTVTEFKGI